MALGVKKMPHYIILVVCLIDLGEIVYLFTTRNIKVTTALMHSSSIVRYIVRTNIMYLKYRNTTLDIIDTQI